MTDNYIIKLPSFWFSEAILQDITTIISIWVVSLLMNFIRVLLSRWANQKFGNYDPNYDTSRRWIRKVIFAPGIIIHELSHIVALVLTGRKIRRVRLFYDTREEAMGGDIFLDGESKGFLATFLAAFAPLFVGSSIVTYIYRYSVTIEMTTGSFLLLLWIVISIVVSCGPSGADLNQIRVSVQSSWEKMIRDIILFPFAVFVYALFGDITLIFLGEIPLIHFLFILLIQLVLYGISRAFVWIVRKITLDLGTSDLNSPSIPIKSLVRKNRRSRSLRHMSVSSINSYNSEFKKKRYSAK